MAIKESLGGVVKSIRLTQGMTQTEFAHHIGVTQPRVCNMEKGTVSLKQIDDLCGRYDLVLKITVRRR